MSGKGVHQRWLPYIVGVGLSLVVAVAVSVPTATGQTDGVDPAQLYQRDCAVCHGSDAAGTDKAPSLQGVGAASVHFMVSTGRMPLNRPGETVERGTPRYDAATIDALVDHVRRLAPGGPEVPQVDLAGADAARGGELYRLICAACHQSVGAGGVLPSGRVPQLGEVTAVQVVEAMRTGPIAMPVFGEAALSDEEAADVAAYVTGVIGEPVDRGGLALWHLGPVPEGAVAIVGALGALALVSLWIEGRRPRRG